MAVNICESIRRQIVINSLIENGYSIRKIVSVGSMLNCVIKGSIDGLQQDEEVGLLLHGNDVVFSYGKMDVKCKRDITTFDGIIKTITFQGIYDGKLDVLVERILKESDVLDLYKVYPIQIAAAYVNQTDIALMGTVKFHDHIAFLSIEDFDPMCPLKAVSLFEDQIDTEAVLVMQYYGGENLNAEEFEKFMSDYVDDIEPMEEVE